MPTDPNDLRKLIFGSLSIIFSLATAIPYLLGLARQTTKPHFMSWLIWTFTVGVAFIAQLYGHAGAGAWITGLGMFQCLGIAVYAFFFGEKTITRGDWACLFFAIAAIPLWLVTHHRLLSVLLVTVIDIVGYYPTIRKSWNKPFNEPALTFGLSALGLFCSVLALRHLSVSNWIYPTACGIAHLTLVSVLLFRRRIIPDPTPAKL